MTTLPDLGSLQDRLSGLDVRTVSVAIRSGYPSLAKIKTYYGEAKANAVVVEMLTDFISFLNIGKTMNVEQITETARLMQDYFPHFNLADMKLFFSKMKMGYYGKFYDRIDGQEILSKLDIYNQERMDEFERSNSDAHNQSKKEERNNGQFHPTVLAAIKSAVGEKKVCSNVDAQQTTSSKNDFGQRWVKQFYNLHRKYGIQSPIRMLKIGGLVMDVNQFLERKLLNNG